MENGSKNIGLRVAAGFLVAVIIIVAVFVSGITLPSLESKTGRLTVLLIDAPVELYQLNVTVTELEVHKVGEGDDDGDWITLWTEVEGIKFNLLDYQDGKTLELASEEIGVGSYNKIRMYVFEASASTTDDPYTPIPLNVPPGKIDVIVEFELAENEDVIVTIDMEPDWAAIAINNKTNNFRPVLKASISEKPAESITNSGED